MRKRDTRTPEQQELDERLAQIERDQARLDETLTRREVIDAIDFVASEYSGNGVQAHDMIADAFRKLAKALS
jgi:hypothetical protein